MLYTCTNSSITVYVKIFSIPKSKNETQKLHLICTNYKNVSDSITAG